MEKINVYIWHSKMLEVKEKKMYEFCNVFYIQALNVLTEIFFILFDCMLSCSLNDQKYGRLTKILCNLILYHWYMKVLQLFRLEIRKKKISKTIAEIHQKGLKAKDNSRSIKNPGRFSKAYIRTLGRFLKPHRPP